MRRAERDFNALPGFGLTLGYTLFYLSALVLLPIGALVLKACEVPLAEFARLIATDRARAAPARRVNRGPCDAKPRRNGVALANETVDRNGTSWRCQLHAPLAVLPSQCQRCGTKLGVEVCSGQAITPGENGVPNFDREKCVHCGACLWNCASASPENPERMAVAFRAGTGGLHSAEN